MLESVDEKLVNFERRLQKRVNLYRQRYISEKFLEIKENFRKEAFNQSSSKNELNVLQLSQIIEESLIRINKYFPNEDGFIRIFMSNTDGDEQRLYMLAASDREKIEGPDNYTFDLNFISKGITRYGKDISNQDKSTLVDSDSLISLEKGILYSGQPAPDKIEGRDFIRYYPTLASKVCFVIWSRYCSDFHSEELFRNAMFDFYITIAANYAALWGSEIEKKLERTIRIVSHESGQVIPVIMDSLKNNFKNSYGAVASSVSDVLDQLELLKLGQTIHSFAFKNIDFIKYPKVDIDLRDLINRFRYNFYKTQIRRKQIDFIYEPESNDRILIYGNYVLFEHALNNLIDNAVKYSYRGTNIAIDVDFKIDCLELHIKTCGSQIPKDDAIFNLYTRGKNTHHIEGNGIGLFMCKKIIDAHGWSISFKSEELYPYDIACMASYVKNKGKYPEIGTRFESEAQQFRFNKAEKHVAKRSHEIIYIPGQETFKEDNNRKTFLNDFYITISRHDFKKENYNKISM